MSNATQRLIDRVRASNGNCSDYRVGKLLGVSTSAVSRWRTGTGHMSTANVEAACKAAGIKDVFRWEMLIEAEREQGADGDFARRVRDEFRELDAGRPAPKDGYLYQFMHGLKGRIASILLVALGLFAARPSPAFTVLDVELVGNCQTTGLCIMRNSRRRVRRLAKLLGCLKSQLVAPLPPPWARIRSMAWPQPSRLPA
jgi:hypothetical protein